MSAGPGDLIRNVQRFYLSDDRVLIQTRESSCGVTGPLSRHLLCDLSYSADDTLACSEGYEGELSCPAELFTQFFTDCVEVPDWTCEELEAAMAI